MADKKRIVTQWLETDAAFGARDVPIPRKRARQAAAAAPAKQPTPPVKAAPAPDASARRYATQSAPPPRAMTPAAVPQPSRPAAAPVRRAEAPAAANRPLRAKPAGPEVPPPPAGDITALPALSRAEKEARMAALQEETCRVLGAFLDDIATRVVFGEGNLDADIMFIGEGPGAEEDRTGRPFVGKAGQLLDKQITAMGYAREEVYIANVVKLRAASPSEEWEGRLKDRPPTPEEVARNIVFLHRQIEIIRPKAIVTLGAPAMKYVTGITEGITKVRGEWRDYRGIPVLPTFHPAYVIRNYTDDTRRKVWDDLKKVMAKVGKKPKQA